MLYQDLIQFEPVESVKQLRASSEVTRAAEDVRTFVISEKMRDSLTKVVFPQLRFDNVDVDHRGLLLIATYGTGKTHLMSCISAVAEDSDLADQLTDPGTAQEAAAIAGKFKVIRVEIGAVTMGLRDIIAAEITEGLGQIGVDYQFPPLDKVTNNKAAMQDMMAAFEEVYPEKGLLLVVDELLDYLRTRRDSEIILDLGFLREMGEFCRDSRFRLIAGVQETLFDNPRFATAQREVQRVRERYQTFRIAREDVAYVVQKRILGKTAAQRANIKEHLSQFAPAFESLGSDLDGFVEMFPIHPAYLKTFENLTIVEKRRVLTSLSEQIRSRLEKEVPASEPGLICSDAYREELDSDPTNRVIPEVSDVLDRTRTLRERVKAGMPARSDVEPALRIVDALAINRLTTDDIEAPVGLTFEELRDDLCLLPEGTPELDPAFLASTIETLVGEISKAVSGQFLTVNPVNGQVYLDLKKDVDYEQQIDDRARTLDQDALDSAYYKALEQLMEVSDSPYVAGYRIWSYELPWPEKRVTRLGYLFMGAPNERSTAQPPRDFYIYFLQPYDPPRFTDEYKTDEVFLRLVAPEEAFTAALRRYAAALEKSREVTSQHKTAFESRMQKHLSEMVLWLKQHLKTHLEATYQGETKPLGQWISATQGPRSSLKEQLDSVASSALDPHFTARYPDFPVFRDEITSANLFSNVQAALRVIASGQETKMGCSALDALQLRATDGQITSDGRFAKQLLEDLKKSGGAAINRTELLTDLEPGVPTWGPWHLEPLWLVVVSAALAYLGKAEAQFDSGFRLNAQHLTGILQLSRLDLESVAFVTQPSGTDIDALRAIGQLIGVTPGSIVSPLSSQVVQELVGNAATEYERATALRSYLLSTPRLWGEELFDDPDRRIVSLDDFVTVLADLKERRNPGSLAQFGCDSATQQGAANGCAEMKRIEVLREAAQQMDSDVRYVETAGSGLSGSDPMHADAVVVRSALRDLLRAETFDQVKATDVRRGIEALKSGYREFAVERHTADRLTSAGDREKADLTESPMFRDLQELSNIEILQGGMFAQMQGALAGIRSCPQFTAAVFEDHFVCPHCEYRPTPSMGPTALQKVADAQQQTRDLWQRWVDTLRESLAEAEVQAQVSMLTPEQGALIKIVTANRLAPGEVTGSLVEAVRQAFQRMDVVRVSPAEIWQDLFPDPSARSPEALAASFTAWLQELVSGRPDPSQVRIVPTEPEEQ